MSKKKKRHGGSTEGAVIQEKKKKPDILFFLVLTAMNLYMVMFSKIASQPVYKAFHPVLEFPAFLVLFNTGMLLFYHFAFSTLKKNTLYVIAGLFGLSVLYLYIISFYPVLEMNGDNAGYLARAHSLILGKGYRNPWYPTEPFEARLKSIGFSLLNVPFILVFGIQNYVGLKLLEFLSLFAGFFFMYRYFENKMEKQYLFLLVLLTAMYSQVVHFSSIIMTESVAFLLLFLNLYLVERHLDNDKPFDLKKVLVTAGMGLLIFFTFTVREAMLTLMAAVPLYLLVKKKWKEAFLMGFVMLACAGGYLALSRHFKSLNASLGLAEVTGPDSPETLGFLQYYLRRLTKGGNKLQSLWVSFKVITQKIWGDPDLREYKSLFGNWLVAAVLGAGIWARVKNRTGLYGHDVFGALLVIVVIIIWHLPADTAVFSRYYYLLIPFLLYTFLYAAVHGLARLKLDTRTVMAVLVILAAVMLAKDFKFISYKAYIAKLRYQDPVKDMIAACEWIRENTPEDSVNATRKSTLSYVWTGRKSIHFFDSIKYSRYQQNLPPEFDQDLLDYYTKNGVRYIVIDTFLYDGYAKVLPVVQRHDHLFKVAYSPPKSPQSRGQTLVLEFLPVE